MQLRSALIILLALPATVSVRSRRIRKLNKKEKKGTEAPISEVVYEAPISEVVYESFIFQNAPAYIRFGSTAPPGAKLPSSVSSVSYQYEGEVCNFGIDCEIGSQSCEETQEESGCYLIEPYSEPIELTDELFAETGDFSCDLGIGCVEGSCFSCNDSSSDSEDERCGEDRCYLLPVAEPEITADGSHFFSEGELMEVNGDGDADYEGGISQVCSIFFSEIEQNDEYKYAIEMSMAQCETSMCVPDGCIHCKFVGSFAEDVSFLVDLQQQEDDSRRRRGRKLEFSTDFEYECDVTGGSGAYTGAYGRANLQVSNEFTAVNVGTVRTPTLDIELPGFP